MKKKQIKIFAMDVDGTLTDGNIYIGDDGELMKSFSVKDGYGIKKLHLHGIVPVIITGRKSKIVDLRAKELGIINVNQGVVDKKAKMTALVSQYKCDFKSIAFIGDDENDLEIIKVCGLSGCPKDAAIVVKKSVDFVSRFNGGHGAVREFIEFCIRLNSNL